MITLFTGMPGAGKTAAMVDLLRNICGDRPIYVHYDEKAKRDPEQSLLHESLKLPHQPVDANQWHKELPHGAILVIDEVQDVWRPRGPSAKIPDAVAALETHRHTGIDIFLTTQSPRLLDSNVRQLIGRHVHIRDVGILGRHWYEWPECNDGMQWKSCVNKRRYKLPKKAFDLYKSTSLITSVPRTIPKAVYIAAVSLLLLAVLAYQIFGMFQRFHKQGDAKQAAQMAQKGLAAGSVTTGGGYVAPVSRDGPIDDRTDWIPRISNKPESAPAYDHLRVVLSMPIVQVGYCVADVCKCLTQQGTDAGLSARECRQFVEHPPFNPYRPPKVYASDQPAAAGESGKKSAPSGAGGVLGGVASGVS